MLTAGGVQFVVGCVLEGEQGIVGTGYGQEDLIEFAPRRLMSSRVTTATGTITWRSPRNARRLAASGTRNAAPSAVRPNTITAGGMCSTATG